MRHLTFSVTAVAVVAFACSSAGAGAWVDMNLTNGDFSNAGLGTSYSSPSGNGTLDNHLLFSNGWQVATTTTSGTPSIKRVAGMTNDAVLFSSSGGITNTLGRVIHDPWGGYVVESRLYKIEFYLSNTGYSYKFYAGFMNSNTGWITKTNLGEPKSDQLSSSGWTKVTLYWDNTNTYTSDPLSDPSKILPPDWDTAGDIVNGNRTWRTVVSTDSINLGQTLQIGFEETTRTLNTQLLMDNVTVYQWAEEPVLFANPATEYTIDFGTLDVGQAGDDRLVTIGNNGVAASLLSITSAYPTTADGGFFTLVGDIPISLAGGQSAQYSIGFGGAFTTGLKTTDLVFVTSAGNVTYHLRAQVGDVPEPATMAMVVVGGLAVLLRRKRN
ncbi:MAG: PEP-CTERM sorting domain-containing protein [Planctomycetaceae bacterium]|nr:PEP-CTERM sorting domain-containing protein [Planctomycetaceae bacterium]